MNFSTKLLKYLEGMRIVELLHDDERAIFPLFGLSFDITAETVLEQEEEFYRDLQEGKLQEIPDYDVNEVSDPKNYTGTGKLQYELHRYGDEKIIDVLYAIFGEKLNGTFRELYDNHILEKIKKMASKSRDIVEQLQDADPEIFENNFPSLMNRYNWSELEAEYQKDKRIHTVTMEWLLEKQERELQKVLMLDIMHHADEPSTHAIEDSDYQYHRSFLSHNFTPSADYKPAYTKFMTFATRKEGMIIPKLGEYGKYIANNINKFRPEQKKALFGIIKQLGLIHADMVNRNPELGKYLGITNDEGIEGTRYFAVYINLLKMFEQSWFNEFRSDKKYSLKWIEQFLNDLMRSEWRDEIVDEWYKPDKKKTVLGYIIGCLITAGVLKGSDSAIASAMVKYIKFDNKEIDGKAFATYFGKGRKTRYCDWICEYVKP
jgi:hypothetical protein